MSGTNIVYKAITATHAMLPCEILGCEHNPPIVVLINASVVPKLVEFLSCVRK
jgi:hypothetical protein